jgi:uncharacterized protein YjlB
LLVYRAVLDQREGKPEPFEELFNGHGWSRTWRDGIYDYHHFHTTAHEVLGVVRGRVRVEFGGPGGVQIQLEPGDVVVIPAGVAHRNTGDSGNLLVVGGYAGGRDWDLRRGDPTELDILKGHIGRVPLPDTDPVHGFDGPLPHLWAKPPATTPGIP